MPLWRHVLYDNVQKHRPTLFAGRDDPPRVSGPKVILGNGAPGKSSLHQNHRAQDRFLRAALNRLARPSHIGKGGRCMSRKENHLSGSTRAKVAAIVKWAHRQRSLPREASPASLVAAFALRHSKRSPAGREGAPRG